MESIRFITDGKRHLVCVPYSIENLHKMAKILGINRRWFHSGKNPHYDIPIRRIKEIESMCEKVASKDLVSIINSGELF